MTYTNNADADSSGGKLETGVLVLLLFRLVSDLLTTKDLKHDKVVYYEKTMKRKLI